MAGDEEYEIPESGAVFTFGRSLFAENLSSHFFIRNDPILEISCGDEHTALVCKSGRVFLFGNNDYGQLGFGHTKVVNKPSCLKYLKPFHSTHVACGKGHTIISTACARIFTFGCNSDGQLGVGDLNDRIVPQMLNTGLTEGETISAVAAGCHHSAFLTEKGDAYLWGSNSDGQCGVEDASYIANPQKLVHNLPITSLSCGYYHTAFISEGIVFTFGEEDNGKLGRVNKGPKHVPEKIQVEGYCNLVKCGGSHTLVSTDDGTVYAFGSNFSGQLGIGNSDTESSVPVKVEIPENNKVVCISCGESHSAFVTNNGLLYTCGDSRYGKLCNEDESTNFNKPNLITLFENYFCTFVSCGGCHTMVLARVRNPDSNLDISITQKNRELLPPLKAKTDLDSPKITNSKERNIESEKDHLQNGEDIEECDSKSNTESNLNNEDLSSHPDDIYSEIKEIQMKTIEDESKIEWDTTFIKEQNESNGNDLVVAKSDGPLKKLMNVFKKKKSCTAILLTEEKGDNSRRVNTQNGNPKSKACVIL